MQYKPKTNVIDDEGIYGKVSFPQLPIPTDPEGFTLSFRPDQVR